MDRDSTRTFPTTAVIIPVAEVAQADLRERQGGPAALRNCRPRHAARPPARGRHLGGRQPRLPRLRGLSAASRGRARHGIGGETDPARYVAGARRAAARATELRCRAAQRAANSMASRSRRESSTSPEPSRSLRTPRACWRPRLEGMLPSVRITEVLATSSVGPVSPTDSRICERAIRPPTNRRCSRRSSPTAPTSACRAWPTRRAA